MKHGQKTDRLVWKTGGGRVELSPSRGRVLGISLDGNEALWRPGASDAAWNLGGERLWIGPETAWFWKTLDRPDFTRYQVPPPLDPDDWRVIETGPTTARASIELKLHSWMKDSCATFLLEKDWRLLGKTVHGGIGFQSTTSLRVVEGTPGQMLDLWAIVQVPTGGTLLTPTVGRAQVRDYFDPTPANEQVCAEGRFELRVGGPVFCKAGIVPGQSCGRVAYVREAGGKHLVLTRSFPVHPALAYADAPLDQQGTQGDAVQLCNDGGQFGGFGELEHRSPAMVVGEVPQTWTETHVTTLDILDEPALGSWKTGFLNQA